MKVNDKKHESTCTVLLQDAYGRITCNPMLCGLDKNFEMNIGVRGCRSGYTKKDRSRTQIAEYYLNVQYENPAYCRKDSTGERYRKKINSHNTMLVVSLDLI